MCDVNNPTLAKVLNGKAKLPETMKDTNIDKLMERAKSIIVLNLSDDVIIEVAEEKDVMDLWGKIQASI